MTHTPVNSTAIKSLGFDPETNELHVTFHNGTVAKHSAEKAIYEKLLASESVGKAYADFKRKPVIVEKTNKFG